MPCGHTVERVVCVVHLFPAEERKVHRRTEMTKAVTRTLDGKTAHLDARLKRVSFANWHHESNRGCTEVQTGAALRAAGSPAASERTIKQHGIFSLIQSLL
jgi:hypothetical protein